MWGRVRERLSLRGDQTLGNGEGSWFFPKKGGSVEYQPQHRFSTLWKGHGQSKEDQWASGGI